jgi:hypothetical protein
VAKIDAEVIETNIYNDFMHKTGLPVMLRCLTFFVPAAVVLIVSARVRTCALCIQGCCLGRLSSNLTECTRSARATVSHTTDWGCAYSMLSTYSLDSKAAAEQLATSYTEPAMVLNSARSRFLVG